MSTIIFCTMALVAMSCLIWTMNRKPLLIKVPRRRGRR